MADIADGSVPLILTTAPDSESACEWLAQWAAAILIPSGSLICFSAQQNRDVMILGRHLRYWWLFAQPQPFNARLVEDKHIMSYTKMAFWHVKNTRRSRVMVPDVLREDRRFDPILSELKDAHAHGVGPLIEALTDPGELIVDPFAATDLAVNRGRQAAAMGRKWIGCAPC